MAPRDVESEVIFRARTGSLSRRGLRRYAGLLRDRIGRGRGFLCLIAGDGELRRLNRQFLKRDYAADVLSFRSAAASGMLGEMAISMERAREQARESGHRVEEELKILMLHGALHLAGMDHERDGGEMARAELRWRKRLGLPAGLIERVEA